MKPKDWDGLLGFYDRLSRQRKLLPHEESRVIELAEKEKHARWMRGYYERTKDNPERKKKLAEKDARYYEKHREARLAVSAEYRKKNPEKNAEACRRYREKRKAEGTVVKPDPEKNREACRRYREKVRRARSEASQ